MPSFLSECFYLNFVSFTAELKGIQDALRDPELQKMILKIDGSSEPEKVSLLSLATIAKFDMCLDSYFCQLPK